MVDEKHRGRITEEILSTERSYVNFLRILMTKWVEPIEEAAMGKSPILSIDECKILFSNVKVIYSFNQFFLKALEEIHNSDNPNTSGEIKPGHYGACFVKYYSFFKLYTTYVNNHGDATVLLQQLLSSKKGNKKFIAFANNVKKTSEGLLDLSSLLVMPVQRVPRYSLLLKELIKNTDKMHSDFEKLEEAFKGVNQVAEHINTSLRKIANVTKVLDFMDKLVEREDLLAANRIFEFEGDIKKYDGKNLTDCYCVLFSDLLCITVRKDDSLQMTQRLAFNIYTKYAEWNAPDAQGVAQYALSIQTDEGQSTECTNTPGDDNVVFLFATEAQRTSWTSHISKCIDNIQNAYKSRVAFALANESNANAVTNASKQSVHTDGMCYSCGGTLLTQRIVCEVCENSQHIACCKKMTVVEGIEKRTCELCMQAYLQAQNAPQAPQAPQAPSLYLHSPIDHTVPHVRAGSDGPRLSVSLAGPPPVSTNTSTPTVPKRSVPEPTVTPRAAPKPTLDIPTNVNADNSTTPRSVPPAMPRRSIAERPVPIPERPTAIPNSEMPKVPSMTAPVRKTQTTEQETAPPPVPMFSPPPPKRNSVSRPPDQMPPRKSTSGIPESRDAFFTLPSVDEDTQVPAKNNVSIPPRSAPSTMTMPTFSKLPTVSVAASADDTEVWDKANFKPTLVTTQGKKFKCEYVTTCKPHIPAALALNRINDNCNGQLYKAFVLSTLEDITVESSRQTSFLPGELVLSLKTEGDHTYMIPLTRELRRSLLAWNTGLEMVLETYFEMKNPELQSVVVSYSGIPRPESSQDNESVYVIPPSFEHTVYIYRMETSYLHKLCPSNVSTFPKNSTFSDETGVYFETHVDFDQTKAHADAPKNLLSVPKESLLIAYGLSESKATPEPTVQYIPCVYQGKKGMVPSSVLIPVNRAKANALYPNTKFAEEQEEVVQEEEPTSFFSSLSWMKKAAISTITNISEKVGLNLSLHLAPKKFTELDATLQEEAITKTEAMHILIAAQNRFFAYFSAAHFKKICP